MPKNGFPRRPTSRFIPPRTSHIDAHQACCLRGDEEGYSRERTRYTRAIGDSPPRPPHCELRQSLSLSGEAFQSDYLDYLDHGTIYLLSWSF